MDATIIPASIALLVLFWAVGAYKRLVSLRSQSRNAFAQIDEQLKRRHGLIPDLVETSQAYMKHEREALEALIAACNQALAANAKVGGSPADAAAMRRMTMAENVLGSALDRTLALAEAYPDLKTDRNMMQLMEELTGTQNRIAFARQVYNGGVMQYNAALEQFPGSIIATVFAFRPAELLQADESLEQPGAMKVAV
jgi:LemA protein